MYVLSRCIVLIAFVVVGVRTANILAVSTLASPSHHIWNKQFMLGLVAKGHNVTMLSHNEEKKPINNLTLLHIKGIYDKLDYTFNLISATNHSFFEAMTFLYDYYHDICVHDLSDGNEAIETLLRYPADFKFDVIIWDVNTGQCLYPLIERFGNPPVVGISAFGLVPMLDSFNFHVQPSYLPTLSMDYSSEMTFLERCYNTYCTYMWIYYKKYIYMPKQHTLAQEYFGKDIRPLDEIEMELSGVLLINNDPVLDYPQALPPNIISVGGLHITPGQTLNEDLSQIVDNAKHGVILFSLGTNVRSDMLGERVIQEFLKVFSELPYTVLWKFESDSLDNIPSNVVIRKWLPQNDILGHPKTKLFITHGGALSTQEAIYHGVPMISMPFFLDQVSNAKRIVDKKLGRSLYYNTMTIEIIRKELLEVLNNPLYSNNVKRLSMLFRNQPQSPLDRAITWTEYVLKHGTSKHLQLPTHNLYTFQILLLDIFGLLALLIFVTLFIVIKLFRRCLRGSKTKTTSRKDKRA